VKSMPWLSRAPDAGLSAESLQSRDTVGYSLLMKDQRPLEPRSTGSKGRSKEAS